MVKLLHGGMRKSMLPAVAILIFCSLLTGLSATGRAYALPDPDASAGTLAELISSIAAAPGDGTQYFIRVTAGFDITETIRITGNKNITIYCDDAATRLIRGAGYAGDMFTVSGSGTAIQFMNITIDGNKDIVEASGSIVRVENYGSLLVGSGASLQNNYNNGGHAGGIYIGQNGSCLMAGGAIRGNASVYGGGVSVERGGTFEMSGGEIKDNLSRNGGGIWLCGTLRLSSGAQVDGSNDVCISGGKIEVTDALTATGTVASISVRGQGNASVLVKFLNGLQVTEYVSRFALCQAGFEPEAAGDCLVLRKPGLGAVYLDAVAGDDGNSGAAPASAVKTFAEAKSMLTADGILYIAATVTIKGGETWSLAEGQKIMRNPGFTGRMINVPNSGVSLTLENITIDGGLTTPDACQSMIYVYGGSLIMNAGAILRNNNCQNPADPGESAVYVYTGTFTMNDGSITGNYSGSNGGGVLVHFGTLTMNGGLIAGNHSHSVLGGGGVCVSRSVFNMNGGVIRDNQSSGSTYGYGGGVTVTLLGTFNMSGGSISGNAAGGSGGGVYVQDATSDKGRFTMTAGSIAGNTARTGGGVYAGGIHTMSGGDITGNTASTAGGGVYVGGTFDMSGGSVAGNAAPTGGGVSVRGGALRMKSAAGIGRDNALCLGPGSFINVTGALSGSPAADIVLETYPVSTNGVQVASVDAGYLGATGETILDRFTVPFGYELYAGTGDGQYSVFLRRRTMEVAVSFESAYGTGTPVSQAKCFSSTYGKAADGISDDPLPSPSQEGYTFAGWWTGVDGAGTRALDTTDVIAATGHTLYAKWTTNRYTVHLDTQGGGDYYDRIAEYNSKLKDPGIPSKAQHTFEGWYKEAECVNPWIFSEDTVPAHDITIYAKWTINVYTVSFDSQGGSAVNAIQAAYNTTIQAPEEPVKAGYTFIGWYPDMAATSKAWDFTTQAVTTNMWLFARWRIIYYSVTFYSQGGSEVPSMFYTYNTRINAPEDPTRTGYSFLGWYKEPDCINAWNFSTDWATGSVKLFASWLIDVHTVTFMSQGGSDAGSIPAPYNTLITAPGVPTRTGYDFAGWYREAECATAWDFAADRVTDDVTLFAKWTNHLYTVTYDSQTGSKTEYSVPYNGTLVAPAAPERTGYAFGGWYREAACATAWIFSLDRVRGDVTLYAKWTVRSYIVSFISQGGSAVSPISSPYNTLINAPAAPARAGYAFGGWYREAACANAWNFGSDRVPAHDIALYAKWTAKRYTVSFDSRGGSPVGSISGCCDAKIAAPAAPARTGYTFAGWYKDAACTAVWRFDADTVPAHDITLFAGWMANTYKVTFNAQGGSPVSDITAQYGKTITAPEAPTRNAYHFNGWYRDSACKTAWNFAADRVTADMTLWAGWSYGVPAQPVVALVSYNTLRVTWPAIPGAPGYEVWRSTSSGGLYKRVAAVTVAGCTNDGLTSGVTYYYKVRSCFQYGNQMMFSAFSAAANNRPVPVAPAAQARATGYNGVKVTWGAVAGATKYELWRSTGTNGTYRLLVTTASCGYTNTNLATGATYCYKVRAYRVVNSAKVYGKWSAVVSARTALGAPGWLKAIRLSATSVKLSWSAVAGRTKYEIWRCGAANGVYSLVGTTTYAYWTNTKLTAGKTYRYKVRAYHLEGARKVYGGYTAPYQIKPAPPVPAHGVGALDEHN